MGKFTLTLINGDKIKNSTHLSLAQFVSEINKEKFIVLGDKIINTNNILVITYEKI
jgi:hypothetical protein